MDMFAAFEFQLNTIQRLTETETTTWLTRFDQVPIKHYPTINWNAPATAPAGPPVAFQLNTIQRLTETVQQKT